MNAILLLKDAHSPAVGPTYLENKLSAFYKPGQPHPEPNVTDNPVLVDASDHPELDPSILDKINSATDCVLRQLRPRFRLEPNEQINSDRFGYLKAAFNGYTAGTVLLTRVTSLATFYIVFPDIQAIHHIADGVPGGVVEIQEGGQPVYPIPPKHAINTAGLLRASASEYTWTRVNPTSRQKIDVSWSGPSTPSSAGIWWALYRGVMPSWSNLKDYNGDWHWLSEKGENLPSVGSKTLSVDMTSGAIYTLALFKKDWDLMDYQQFTAP